MLCTHHNLENGARDIGRADKHTPNIEADEGERSFLADDDGAFTGLPDIYGVEDDYSLPPTSGFAHATFGLFDGPDVFMAAQPVEPLEFEALGAWGARE